MQKIAYADMHCDSVTECKKKSGQLFSFVGQASVQKLLKAGCAVQCFAIFTDGEDGAQFEEYAAFYKDFIKSCDKVVAVTRAEDVIKARSLNKLGAILTIENLGFLKGDASAIEGLKDMGVRMASLVWNNANAFAYPNLVFKGGVPHFNLCEERGLTAAGKEAVKRVNENGIILDVSHLSDGGVNDALNLSSAPVVASHSNCRAVCGVSRNLTDGQIKKIAEGGGVGGINFCRDFLGGATAYEGVYLNLLNMIDKGGEDFPALGSDFDGIPVYEELPDCTAMPDLFSYLQRRGIKPRVIEKFALGNFMRVFKEVCG